MNHGRRRALVIAIAVHLHEEKRTLAAEPAAGNTEPPAIAVSQARRPWALTCGQQCDRPADRGASNRHLASRPQFGRGAPKIDQRQIFGVDVAGNVELAPVISKVVPRLRTEPAKEFLVVVRQLQTGVQIEMRRRTVAAVESPREWRRRNGTRVETAGRDRK